VNAWGALTVVLVVLTIVAGLVALGGWCGLCALQAQRTRYEFHAWRMQLPPPRGRESIDASSEVIR
jgi:hypothetical protein